MTFNNYHFILASGSPRRKELLGLLDLNFKVDTSHSVDETIPDNVIKSPDDIPAYLSGIKAAPYLNDLSLNEVLITADTVVICEGKVLGKPQDENAAKAMLRLLADNTHKVITGVTIATIDSIFTFSETTEVEFAPLTDDEIDYYVAKYKPLDKAGAYGIQEWIGAAAVKSMQGSYYNVMGLPVNRLYRELKRILS